MSGGTVSSSGSSNREISVWRSLPLVAVVSFLLRVERQGQKKQKKTKENKKNKKKPY